MPGCETCQWNGPPEKWMENTLWWQSLIIHRALHQILWALAEAIYVPLSKLMKGAK